MEPPSKLFSAFPKERPFLPKVYQDIYQQEYTDNREGNNFVTNLAQKLEQWMHHQITANAKVQKSSKIIEIGAGTLNHVRFEENYDEYDFIEPMHFLFSDKPELEKVNNAYDSINDVPNEKHYDRIISVAVLEHVTDLPNVIAKSCCLLEKQGVFQAGIPSEGGFLWTLSWKCTTGLSYRLRHNLDYGVLMRHEHVNKALEIIEIVKYFYGDVKIKWFGIPWLHGSLYGYIHASNPNVELAKRYLSTEKSGFAR